MRTRADTGACLGALGLAWLAGMALHLQLERLPPLPLLWGLLALGGSLCGAAWAWPRARALALLGV
ncbi:MAG: hypothetical protein M3O01_11010, partial [Pseudomonadota bacterium]|nr:hypothetical protein [Pseudomonadota bacterium]